MEGLPNHGFLFLIDVTDTYVPREFYVDSLLGVTGNHVLAIQSSGTLSQFLRVQEGRHDQVVVHLHDEETHQQGTADSDQLRVSLNFSVDFGCRNKVH